MNKQSLMIAKEHQSRLAVHCQKVVKRDRSDDRVKRVVAFAADLLPADKATRYYNSMSVPFLSNRVVDKCFSSLSRVFDGRNPSYTYEFTNKNLSDKWRSSNERKYIHSFVKGAGWNTIKERINSVLIVLKNEDGRPNIYTIDISDVHGIDIQNDEIVSICYTIDGKKKGYIDGNSIIEYEGGGDKISIISEVSHNLSKCPARFIYATSLGVGGSECVKVSPITHVLGDLDWYLFLANSNNELNTVSRFPIYSTYASGCDYETDHDYCDLGYLRDRSSGNHITSAQGLKSCPVCEKRKFVGAGSLIEIDPPSEDNGKIDLRDPVVITPAPVPTLEYNLSDLDRREKLIIKTVVGVDGLGIDSQAVNEKQVLALLESLETALDEVQNNIESLVEWLESIFIEILYGDKALRSISIDMGTEHFVMSTAELINLYSIAKGAGLGEFVLSKIDKMITETDNRNNPTRLAKDIAVKILMPYVYLSNTELSNMLLSGALDRAEYIMTTAKDTILRIFESESELPLSAIDLTLPNAIQDTRDKLREIANNFIINNNTING